MSSFRNAAFGPLKTCQVCDSRNLELVIDLGHQPLCDSLVSEAGLNAPEETYPLRQMRCVECFNNQLDYVVESTKVYHPDYPYKSGVTKELVTYQGEMATAIVELLGLGKESFVVDFGSNDGTLLKGFRKHDVRVLGVEPTNIAKLANADGILTLQRFFNKEVAQDIRDEHGPADVITATNVFAHMADLGSVMEGIVALLGDNGVFVTESHYLVDVLEKSQYDTIYHEHIRSYSLTALVTLCAAYGLEVFRTERGSRYAGNLRTFVARKGRMTIDASVGKMMRDEVDFGLGTEAPYERFRAAAYESRSQLMEFLINSNREGRMVVGKSCPGRGSTLLNFCGVDSYLMRYLSEQEASLKVGQYLPGKHIPIVSDAQLKQDNPSDIVILAWHYKEAITRYLRDMGVTSRIYVPLPSFQLVSEI